MQHKSLFLWKVIGVKEIVKIECSSDKAELELSLHDFSGPLICQCENNFLNLLQTFLQIGIVVFKTSKQASFIPSQLVIIRKKESKQHWSITCIFQHILLITWLPISCNSTHLTWCLDKGTHCPSVPGTEEFPEIADFLLKTVILAANQGSCTPSLLQKHRNLNSNST